MSDVGSVDDAAADTPADGPANLLALVAAALVVVGGATGAVLVGSMSSAAAWPAGMGAALASLGVAGGNRGALGAGSLLVALGALVATHNEETGSSLALNATLACICMVMLVAGDISFVNRRETVASASTLRGFVESHAIAVATGVLTACAALAIVLAFSWPSWLVVLPATLVALGALLLARSVHKVRRASPQPPTRPSPPTPPPPFAGQLPPPPPPRQFPPPHPSAGQLPPPPPPTGQPLPRG